MQFMLMIFQGDTDTQELFRLNLIDWWRAVVAFGSIYAITSSMRCVSEKYVCVCVCAPMELSNNHVHCKSKWCAMNGVFVRILHGWIQQFDADCVFV